VEGDRDQTADRSDDQRKDEYPLGFLW